MIDETTPVEEVACQFLGARLRTTIDGVVTEVLLTEVEAYGGADDPASHAYRGPTDRNRAMFGPAGMVYVYRAYGVHWCVNISTGPAGSGEAVLLRAGVPTEGEAVMVRRRGRRAPLADGPGKLTQALGIAGEHDGLLLGEGPISLIPRAGPCPQVLATPRVGVSRERERPWRFVIVG